MLQKVVFSICFRTLQGACFQSFLSVYCGVKPIPYLNFASSKKEKNEDKRR